MKRREAVLVDPATGWGSGPRMNIGTYGPRGLHLAGSRSVTRLAHQRPAWLAVDQSAGTTAGDAAVLLLGRDGRVRRVGPNDARLGLPAGTVLVGPEDVGARAADLVVIARSVHDIYLLDRGHRQILVAARRGYLRAALGPVAEAVPVDVAGLDGGAAVLLSRPEGGGRTRFELRWHGTGDLRLGLATALPPGSWSRCLAGRDGRVWVIDTDTDAAYAVSVGGAMTGPFYDGPGIAASLDDAPLVVNDVVVLPDPIGPRNRNGEPVPRPEALAPPELPRVGTWVSDALDGLTEQLEWHRIIVDVDAAVPDAVVLRTFTSDRRDAAAELAAGSPDQWAPPISVGAGRNDVLVLSPPGRYLWVRAELRSDGYQPVYLRSLRAEYPRRSLLRFLPAVYSSDPVAAQALSRYLAVAGTVVDEWDRLLAELPRYVDSQATPDGFVAYLSSWLDVPLEGTWRPDQQRRLLTAVTGYLSRRGTVDGIRQHVAAYLAAMSGHDLDPDGLPRLVEGFTQRNYRTLPAHERDGRPLWSLGRVARLQPDRFDRLGSVRLVDHGDPTLDMYTEHAHRLAVHVPAAIVASPADRQMLARAVAQEAPAHVATDLILVGPALCLGAQSQLGIDTLLAAPAAVRLTCAASARGEPEAAQERSGPRLGGLTVLGCAHQYAGQLDRRPPDGSVLAVA